MFKCCVDVLVLMISDNQIWRVILIFLFLRNGYVRYLYLHVGMFAVSLIEPTLFE